MGDEAGVDLSELLKTHVHVCAHPVIDHKMTQLRRKETSSKHFRELMREVTQYVGYKATEGLTTTDCMVETPV